MRGLAARRGSELIHLEGLDLMNILEAGQQGIERAAAAAARTGPALDPAGLEYLPPLSKPPKIVCVGMNYQDHADENKLKPQTHPTFFARFTSTLIGFASYHTDLSGRNQGEAPGASITAWDLSDVAAGVTWHVWRSDFALGVSTAFGNQPTPSVPNPPEGAPTPQDLQTHEMLVTVSLGWKISY